MIDRLKDGHRRILDRAETLRGVLKADAPDMAALADARWQIGVAIMQHLAVEDRHLYANLARDPRSHIAALGRQAQADFADSQASYAGHVKSWPNERILRDWPRYRAETLRQLDLLGQRIAKVEAELYPLAETMVDITAPQAPSASWTRDAFDLKDAITRA